MSDAIVGVALPVGDWQFWVVTCVCVAAAAVLLRNVLPAPFLRGRKRMKGEKRAKLTISAKRE